MVTVKLILKQAWPLKPCDFYFLFTSNSIWHILMYPSISKSYLVNSFYSFVSCSTKLNCQTRLTSILRLGGSSGEVVSCRLELDPTTKFTQVIL